MALSPCLLVLALSVAHAGGGGSARPAVRVEELARPTALAPVELLAAEPREVSSARFRTSFMSAYIPPPDEPAEEAWMSALLPRRPSFSLDAEYAAPTPDWPATELRWQAKPRRSLVLFRRTTLPVAWHLFPPPLEWPAPRHERPRHVVVRVLPPRRWYCGGCGHFTFDVVPPALPVDGLELTPSGSSATDLAALTSVATSEVGSD